jgi:hypothetical protein
MGEVRDDVRIKGATFKNVRLKDALKLALQMHESETEDPNGARYYGLATTASGLVSQFKEKAWNDPRWQAKYPDTYNQIRVNQDLVENKIDPLKRRPLSSDRDEEVFDLRELLEPTK